MHGLLLAGLAVALPLGVAGHPARPQTALSPRGIDVNAYRFSSTAKYNEHKTTSQMVQSFAYSKDDDYVATATKLVKSTFPNMTFRTVKDHYIGTNGIGHVHFKQTAHDIDIDNADFNVNIGRDGKVFTFGNSFYQGEMPKTNPMVKRDYSDPVKALHGAIKTLKIPVKPESAKAMPMDEVETFKFEGTSGALSEPKAKLVYIQKDGNLHLTWRVETDVGDNWLLSYVDSKESETVHNVVDYVASADYKVFAFGLNDPTEGQPSMIKDPWNTTGSGSPFTWHGDGKMDYTVTRGNNVAAQDNPSGGSQWENNYRPDSPQLSFVYDYSDQMEPEDYKDFAITQLFYTTNTFHDVLYSLGFTEEAGNFQVNNGNKGGKGNDFAICNAQDGSGTNNANFATPPDGQPGRMRMYTWTTSKPKRDGDLEAGIVIHEYTHGLSNRLCGGPANSNCLNDLEAGGMGEGWGDFYATAIRLKQGDTHDTDYTMGEWAANQKGGIREYPYSTNMQTNPYTYADVKGMREVHGIGTVWATILYDVLWNLIDDHGMGKNVMPKMVDGVPTDGRTLAMKLVLDGMTLMPCNPNFMQARDAIIDADMALTKGANKCSLMKAFAKRGLGSNTKPGKGYTNNFDMPSGC
ncbi:ammonium transporter [Microsporum ferrugineum]